MSALKLRPLPIIERWDCCGCGKCCRGVIVALNAEDLKKLREQHWEKDPEMKGIKIITRMGLLAKKYRLTHQKNGRCIFQSDDMLCRIHKKFGFDAKPHICQLAPLQMVPRDTFAYVTLRRYCPAAVVDQGRTVEEQLPEYRAMVERSHAAPEPAPPPILTRRVRRGWPDLEIVIDAIDRLMLDQRYPLIRRLAHSVEFCDLLDRCRFRKLDHAKLLELVSLLKTSSIEAADVWFQERRRPSDIALKLFRQTLMESLRLHPAFVPESSWAERWRLIRAAMAFSRGQGEVPSLRMQFPPATFESLEEPLGPLSADVMSPLTHYFEQATVSFRYAAFKHRLWTVTEAFRALALGYPIAMWTLRFAAGMKQPSGADGVDAVIMLDRSETHAALNGVRHRFRIRALTNHRQLLPLLAWYGR